MSRYKTQIREVINRNTFVSLALADGFNAFLPVYDGGIDFILYRESDGEIRKVQLKGRWTIDRKYLGRDIWIAFPIAKDWYLIRHDDMVALAEQQGFTSSKSWKDQGIYNLSKVSEVVLRHCAPHRFAPLSAVAEKAASETEQDN